MAVYAESYYFAPGEMAERSIAAVLKTVEGNTSGGSNPSLSADTELGRIRQNFVWFFPFLLDNVRSFSPNMLILIRTKSSASNSNLQWTEKKGSLHSC